MNNEISIEKIISDIKQTGDAKKYKKPRQHCEGLYQTLSSDGYVRSIVNWTRVTSPSRIDRLLEYVDLLVTERDAALANELVWEKTMMEACGEDGPASVAAEIKSLRELRDTALEQLREQVKQLVAENVSIKAMNDCLSEELRGYESDGAFEGPKMHLLWWQVETPATDRIVAGIKADGVEAAIEHILKKFEGVGNIGVPVLALEWFAKQLREGAK